MEMPILQTKLYVPQPQPGGLIPRPGLLEKLDKSLEHRLTLISAPAGSGKTTLISQWLHLTAGGQGRRGTEEDFTSAPLPLRSSIQFAWLSLDEADNDPVRFWTYIIAALETVQPGLGANTLPLLRSSQPPPLEIGLTFLLNDLAALPHDVTLVVDDYHLIENTDIHTTLTLLVDRLPPQLHLILTSRADPPLPLARWRVKRQLSELRAETLRFSPTETDLLFNHLLGLNLTSEQIAALEAKTEGWVAGLQLAALSLQDGMDVDRLISAFTGTHRYILDYMTEEILGRQPEDVQRFLLQTSILERLTGPLCDAVTGRAGGQAMLQQLARANLFIVPLDDQGQWYRYHQLFADLLRHHLQQPLPAGNGGEDKGGVAELHQRAAVWCEQAGWIEAAIQHTIAAQDFERAGRLLLQYIRVIVDQGGTTLLLRWLKALPEPWLQSQLKLNVMYAWLLFLAGNFEAVQHKLAEIDLAWNLANEPTLEPAETEGLIKQRDLPGLITGLRAQIAMFKGDLPAAITLAEQALAQLSTADPGPRGIIAQNLATVYWLTGETEKANRLLADFGEATSNRNDPAALFRLSQLAEIKWIQGHYRQAEALCRRILQVAAELDHPELALITGTAHAELGLVLYEWNELAVAEEHLQRGINLANQGAGLRALVLGYFGLSKVLLAQNNFAAVFEIIQQMEQLAQNLDSTIFLSLTELLRVNLWLAQGDLAAVAQWRQAGSLQVNDEIDGLNAILLYTGLARVWIAEGELDAASALLARLLAFMEAIQRTEGIIQILALQAVTWQVRHQLEPALSTLQRALALAEPEGYIRTFVDEGAPMVALLLKLRDRQQRERRYASPSLNYLNTLLAAAGADEVVLDRKASLAALYPTLSEPLTEREIEVLQLLATGLSTREIAVQLVITPATLKTHLKNIYAKLEVNSRAQAVVKGKELDLF